MRSLRLSVSLFDLLFLHQHEKESIQLRSSMRERQKLDDCIYFDSKLLPLMD